MEARIWRRLICREEVDQLWGIRVIDGKEDREVQMCRR